MNIARQSFCLLILVWTSLSAFSQKYKTPADTVKLNKEYAKVSNDIADLNAQLTKAQNNLPGYQSNATNANAEAKAAAASSNEQASKAVNGNLKDAKRADKKAKKAYSKAKNSQSAEKVVNNDNDKIAGLTSKINKKKERLLKLDVMHSTINAQVISHTTTTSITPVTADTTSFHSTTPIQNK